MTPGNRTLAKSSTLGRSTRKAAPEAQCYGAPNAGLIDIQIQYRDVSDLGSSQSSAQRLLSEKFDSMKCPRDNNSWELQYMRLVSVNQARIPPTLTCVKAGTHRVAVRFLGFLPTWGIPMLNAETTALLRAVLDEVCESLSRYETGARAHVASKLLEAAIRGDTSIDGLKRVGRSALGNAPTMWR